MENYIVRVLRRVPGKQNNPAHLDGVVEVVENGKRHAFHNAEELWSILGDESKTQDGRVNPLGMLTDDETYRHED